MTSLLSDGSRTELNQVVVMATTADYPTEAPFHPQQAYPEYSYKQTSAENNHVYEAVRQCFYMSGMDSEQYGTAKWNPLRTVIQPGNTVLLKPNMVKEDHPQDPKGWVYTITHGSVIRAVADYVFKALNGDGKVIIADGPQTDSSFEAVVRVLNLDRIAEFYHRQGLDFELIDLRQEAWVNREGVIVERTKLSGDPNGYIAFNVGQHSEFVGHGGEGRYYGADYDTGEINKHHSGGRHEYLVAGTAIKCDVFFNLPKLKTHKKAGITVNLKNLVGINGDKNWLPHHTVGSPPDGGDQFPELTRLRKVEHWWLTIVRQLALSVPLIGTWVYRRARNAGKSVFGDTEDVIRHGNWYGNDTTWRMCLDLNKIILYGREDSTFKEAEAENRKNYLCLVDGIIAGQGRGPLNPDPMPAGILVFGANPAHVDATAAILMGYDPDKIPIVRQSFCCRHFPIAQVKDWHDVSCISNNESWNGSLGQIPTDSLFHFEPHFGWRDHIER
jgi:uncharacterized protein (DUF362 family)